MNDPRGSAVVLAMLLLVLLSAIGMYAVSLPVPGDDARPKHHLETVAGNMAGAGAHAAIARLPELYPPESPLVRQLPVGRSITGKYAASSRKGSAGEFTVLSEGSIVGFGDIRHRVRAVVRYSAREGRSRILLWEDIVSP